MKRVDARLQGSEAQHMRGGKAARITVTRL
jgi:hypothetical protein